MADSTHPGARRVIVWLAALLVCLGATASRARADGDPASDVLATQTVFLPQDGALSAATQSQLLALAASATRAGFPVRLALIATRSDLGSVTALWRQPTAYARFLGQELSAVFRGTLLVVMPNGFGVTGIGRATASATAGGDALAGMAAPGSATALGGAAIGALQRLAAAAGHRLTVARGAATGSPTARSATGIVAWVALAAGAILIVVAWTISLRLRPWRRHDGVASSHGT